MRALQPVSPVEARALGRTCRIIRAGLVSMAVATALACGDGDRRREADRAAPETAGVAVEPSVVPASEAPSAGSIAEQGLEAVSAGGRYRIGIRPEIGRASIGELHAWVVEVSLPDGRAADVRELRFDGGMPQHGHGFDSAPRVTARLGPAVFRVDGVRFSMAGDWTIRVDIAEAGGVDSATFVFAVGP